MAIHAEPRLDAPPRLDPHMATSDTDMKDADRQWADAVGVTNDRVDGIVSSLEPGEDWLWRYVDEVGLC